MGNENNIHNIKNIPLTIFRTKKIMGFAIPISVFIDNNKIGDLKNGKSIECFINPGKHKVLFNCIEKDVIQDIVVDENNQKVEIITHAKMGLLAAVIVIDNDIYK